MSHRDFFSFTELMNDLLALCFYLSGCGWVVVSYGLQVRRRSNSATESTERQFWWKVWSSVAKRGMYLMRESHQHKKCVHVEMPAKVTKTL